jgi:hypothetical protein
MTSSFDQEWLDSIVYRDVSYTQLTIEELVEALVQLAQIGYEYDQFWNVNHLIIDIKERLKKGK